MKATGSDNSLFDQDNNVAITQDLLLENDCNGTATNTASCDNSGGALNNIESITQDNIADNTDDAFSNQENDVAIDQDAGLVNTCDETGTGNNDADCDNDAENFVGPLSQTNTATGEDEATIAQD